jgi:Tol biopolymer transport system component
MGEVYRAAGTEGATYPFWSPDSRSIAFFSPGALKRLDLSRGLPQTLANASPGRGGTWSSRGAILFAPGNQVSLWRIPASGGTTTPATRLEQGQLAHQFPHFCPDGNHFLFYVRGGAGNQGIHIGTLDSFTTKQITASEAAGLCTSAGWLLFLRQGTLVAQRFDMERRELIGEPFSLADRVSFDSIFNAGAFSASMTGLILYRGGTTSRRQLTWFDRMGRSVGTLGGVDDGEMIAPDLSRDGRRVAVTRSEQGNTDVWLKDALRVTRFTLSQDIDRFAIWSPDGSRVAFTSNRKGPFNIYLKDASGAGDDELLVESPRLKTPNSWSSDGRFLLFQVSDDPDTSYDLWVLPLFGDRKPFVFLNQPYEERTGQFSPDGHWVAYVSNESGRHEIYVRPFPGPGGQWQISTTGGIQPRWSQDGKELFYIAPDANLVAVPIAVDGPTLNPGRPIPLFRSGIVGGGREIYQRENYAVSADGRFLINVPTDDALAPPITLLLNWNPERRTN